MMPYMRHGLCLGWPGPPVAPPALVVAHVLGDLSGVIVYPLLALGVGWWLVRCWPTIPGIWRAITISTMAFLVTCGACHGMDIVVLLWPAYWLQAAVKLAMAVSASGAFGLSFSQIPRLRLAQVSVYISGLASVLRDAR